MTTEQYPKVYLYRRIVQAKFFIDNNYTTNIDLGNISGEAYFSKFHFIRLFKKIYGKTPHQYLIAVRIEKAMELLKAGIPVSDVCCAIGFESLSSFCGLFKRIAGIPPAKYLDQHRKLKAQMVKSPLKFIPGCFAEKRGWIKKQQF